MAMADEEKILNFELYFLNRCRSCYLDLANIGKEGENNLKHKHNDNKPKLLELKTKQV